MLNVTSFVHDVPCLHLKDILEKNEDCFYTAIPTYTIYKPTKSVLINSIPIDASKESPAVIIYNKGLHMLNKAWSPEKEPLWLSQDLHLKPAARALLNFARESDGCNIVIFRETSAQHFAGRPGGDFHARRVDNDTEALCCAPHISDPHQMSWRNNCFREAFVELTAEWGTYVHWLVMWWCRK